MGKFRKKPVVIEAIQLTENNFDEIENFLESLARGRHYKNKFDFLKKDDPQGIFIHMLEGNHLARIGNWIIKGIHGKFYPCDPDIFEKTYDPV